MGNKYSKEKIQEVMSGKNVIHGTDKGGKSFSKSADFFAHLQDTSGKGAAAKPAKSDDLKGKVSSFKL